MHSNSEPAISRPKFRLYKETAFTTSSARIVRGEGFDQLTYSGVCTRPSKGAIKTLPTAHDLFA